MSSPTEVSKNRFRFTEQFDLHLAREVYGLNPYEDPRRWATIQVNMIQITGKCISIRTLRERIQNLVKKYLVKVDALEGKSGIEILVTELEDLLHQIANLMSEFQQQKKKILNNAAPSKSSYEKGYDAREESCILFLENDTAATQADSFHAVHQGPPSPVECSEVQDTTELVEVADIECIIDEQQNNEKSITLPSPAPRPPNKRPLAQANILTPLRRKTRDTSIKQRTMQYLEKKNQLNHEIRSKELALQERKQLSEERKFEIDKREREKRLELEERRLHMEEQRLKIELYLFTNQQELIKLLLKKNELSDEYLYTLLLVLVDKSRF